MWQRKAGSDTMEKFSWMSVGKMLLASIFCMYVKHAVGPINVSENIHSCVEECCMANLYGHTFMVIVNSRLCEH